MNYWWVSDYHFTNESVINFYDRPFNSLEEMTETIIQRHNERVKPEDTVYFLGDFVIEEGSRWGVDKDQFFENQLNGNFVFIHGNHDLQDMNKTQIQKMHITYDSKDICMTHYPENADPDVDLNFCGHVHSLYKVVRLNESSLIVNLSVEAWNYYPVSFKEIKLCVKEFLESEKNEQIKIL